MPVAHAQNIGQNIEPILNFAHEARAARARTVLARGLQHLAKQFPRNPTGLTGGDFSVSDSGIDPAKDGLSLRLSAVRGRVAIALSGYVNALIQICRFLHVISLVVALRRMN